MSRGLIKPSLIALGALLIVGVAVGVGAAVSSELTPNEQLFEKRVFLV